jgi:hypothetical protein
MKKQKYKKGIKYLKNLMISWEWEKEADQFGNIVWDTYDCILSFIIETKYQLYI